MNLILEKRFWRNPIEARFELRPLEESTSTSLDPSTLISSTSSLASKQTKTKGKRGYRQAYKTPQFLKRLNLASKMQLRTAYQQLWLDNFEPVALELKFTNEDEQEETIHCATKAIVSFPGSGLSTTLAARALKSWRDGETILILGEHEHNKFKIAQMMLDLAANEDEKKRIKADLTLNYREKKKITILSPEAFLPKVKQKDPFEILNPDIKSIFIDEVNTCAGDPRKPGRAKAIVDLLRHTKSTQENPTQIFAVSSIPRVISEKNKNHAEMHENQIYFMKLFPQGHVIEGQNYQELRRMGYVREVDLQPLQIEVNGLPIVKYAQLFATVHDKKIKTTTIDTSSAIYRLAKDITTDRFGKTRIIAHDPEAADALAKVLCILGKKAGIAVAGDRKGFYELIDASELNEDQRAKLQKLIIRDHVGNEETYHLKLKSQSESQILNSFEADPDSNIIIYCQILNGNDSPTVDTLIIFNTTRWEPNMLRALGHTAANSASSKPLKVIHCDFINGTRTEQSIGLALRDILNTKAPWWRFATNVNVNLPSVASVSVKEPETPMQTDIHLEEAVETVNLNQHRAWVQEGLEPIYWLLKPVARSSYDPEGQKQYSIQLKNHFIRQGKALDEDVLYGKKKDPEHFAEILAFNQKLLARLCRGHHIYSNPEAYQIHVASIAPSLVKLEAKHQGFAEKLVESFYTRALAVNTVVPNEAWLARLDQLLGLHERSTQAAKVQYRSRKFAEVLTKLYGQDFFCFPKNVETALQVFNGQTINRFLLTYLLQSCNPNIDELEKVKTDFSGMFTTKSSRSFVSLQAAILAKYPQAPDEMDKHEFFTQALYKELGIDLTSLVRAAIDISQDSEQVIRAENELQSDIQMFLEEAETTLFSQEKSLINDDVKFQDEIKRLINSHLDSITQEVLFNQLINKIWGDGAIRESVSSLSHRKLAIRPDALTTEVIGIKADPKFESVDLLAANENWLRFITARTNYLADLDLPDLTGLQLGLKARLMTTIKRFAEAMKLTDLTTRQLNLLCGIDIPRDESEQQLLRDFIEFIGANQDRATMPIINKEELIAAIKKHSDIAFITKKDFRRDDIETINYVENLGNNIGLNLNEMARYLQLEDPQEFYQKAFEIISADCQRDNVSQFHMVTFTDEQKKAMWSRNILKIVWGDAYKYIDKNKRQQDIATIIDLAPSSGYKSTFYIYENKVVFRMENLDKFGMITTISADYKSNVWRLSGSESVSKMTLKDMMKMIKPAKK